VLILDQFRSSTLESQVARYNRSYEVMKQDVKAKFQNNKKNTCFEIIDFLNLPLNSFFVESIDIKGRLWDSLKLDGIRPK